MKAWATRNKWWLAGAGVLLLVVVALVIVLRQERGPLEVPLGVEHALALSYPGPELAVKPYDYGVAVSLRIASVKEQNGRRTYDIRYMLNRGGTYNITDYLTTVEGTDPVGLPAFEVRGLETLSEDVDKRIQELSSVDIEIWHHYYETMAVVLALWVGWLGLILFWPRERALIEADPGPVIDPFPVRLRAMLDRVGAGELSDAEKTRLQMMLIDHWRAALPSPGLRMHTTVRHIRADPRFGDAYRTLIDWLHNPDSAVSSAELVDRLSPFARTEPQGGAA